MLKYISKIDPLTYGVDGLRAALIGVSSFSIFYNFIFMVIFSLVMISFGAYLFEKSESVWKKAERIAKKIKKVFSCL